MSYVTNIEYRCDRCRKVIIPDTGTLNKSNHKGFQLITKHSINSAGEIDDQDLPDLCDDCLDSLQEWYSSEKELSDNATMDMALILMSKRIKEYRQCLNNCESEDIGGFMEKSTEETKTEFLDQASRIIAGLS